MNVGNPQPPWSDLHPELLFTIANKLIINPIDIQRFRSVCSSWCNSISPLSESSLLSLSFPLSVPHPPFSTNTHSSLLTLTVIYAVSRPLDSSEDFFSSLSPTTWISFIDEFTPCKLRVRTPLSNACNLVPVNFPSNVNFIDFNVMELGRFYNLVDKYDNQSIRKRARIYSEKVDAVVFQPDGCAVIALLKEGKLGIFTFDLGSTEWEILHDGQDFQFDDIVEFKCWVLGVDRTGRVYDIGYDSSEICPVVPPIVKAGGRRKRLVVSLGLLYLVIRWDYKTKRRRRRKTKFKVYELDEARNEWVEISSLGDRSFFFGPDYSFSASTKELGTCGEDCILYIPESFPSYDGDVNDYVVFRMLNSHLYIGVGHLYDGDDLGVIESYPGYSDTLWPPPPWIWSIDRLKRLEIVEAAVDDLLNRIPDSFKAKVEEETVEGAKLSFDDFKQQVVLKAVREVLELKKEVIRLQETENNIMSLDNLLQEAVPSYGDKESMEILNQIDSMFIENAIVELDSHHAHPSSLIMRLIRLRDANLFRLEEDAASMQISQKEKLAHILTE